MIETEKIFQKTKYLPFRRTGFQLQTQASLRVCWVWTSFDNFTFIWEWFCRKNCSFFGLDSWWRSLRFNQVQNIFSEPFFIWFHLSCDPILAGCCFLISGFSITMQKGEGTFLKLKGEKCHLMTNECLFIDEMYTNKSSTNLWITTLQEGGKYFAVQYRIGSWREKVGAKIFCWALLFIHN